MPTQTLSKMVLFHQPGFSLWNMSDERVQDLKRSFPDIQFVHVTDPAGLAREIVDADALCSLRMTSELFRAARRLNWIHSSAAGIGGLMIPEVLASDVLITNARGIYSPVIAEHTLGVILVFSRRLLDAYRFQLQHRWDGEALWSLKPSMGVVVGKTLGLIGFGSIGQEIAKRARALGMRILAMKKNPAVETELADRVFSLEARHELLRESDFVVLALPHTPETKHVIGKAELDVMKPTAYLINVGRGKLVDEAALLEALRENRIAGAGLDVFETEPLPPDHPLWDAPNVLITPHAASNFPEYWPRNRALIEENIRRFQAGEPLLNLVDKKQGY